MEAVDDFMDYQMQYSQPGVSLPRPEAFHQQYQEYHPPPLPPTTLQQPQPHQQQQQQQPGVCPALREHSLCPYPQHYNPHNPPTNYHAGQGSSRGHNTYPFDPVYHSSGASLPWPSPTQLTYHSWSPNRPLGNRSSFPPTTRQSVPQPYPASVHQSTSRGVVPTNSSSNVSTSGQVAPPPVTSSQAQSARDQPLSTSSREQSTPQSTPQYQQGPRFGEMPPAVTNVATISSGLSQRTLDVPRAYATSNVGPPSTAPTRLTGSVNLPALGTMNYMTPRLPHQPSRQYGGRFDYRVDAAPSTLDRPTGSPRASTSTSESTNIPATRSAAGSDSDSDEELSEHAVRGDAEGGSGLTSDDIAAQRIRAEQVLRGQLSSCKRVASRKALSSLESVEVESLPKSERLCMICYNDFGVASPEGINEAPLRLPKCKHVFGDHCIKKWFAESDSCPYCRDKVPSVMQHPLGDPRVRAYIANLGHLARQPPYNHRRPADVTRLPTALQSTGNTSSAATLAMLRTMGGVDAGRAAATGDRRWPPGDVSDARRRARLRLDNIREAATGLGSDMLSTGRPRSVTGTSGVRFGLSAPSQTLPQSHTQTPAQPQVQGAVQTQAQHQQPPVQGRDIYPIETYYGPGQQASSSHSRQISLASNPAFAMSERPSRPQFLPELFQSAPISDVRMTDSPPIEQSYMMDLDIEVPPTNVNGHRAPFPSQPGYTGWGYQQQQQ